MNSSALRRVYGCGSRVQEILGPLGVLGVLEDVVYVCRHEWPQDAACGVVSSGMSSRSVVLGFSGGTVTGSNGPPGPLHSDLSTA